MSTRSTPFTDPQERFAAGMLGMRIFLLSLGVLFGASVIGYVTIRMVAPPATGALPPLPRGLWLSTLLLLAGSATVHGALQAARQDLQERLQACLTVTALLGVSFLAVQGVCWIAWAGPMREALRGAGATYLLTGFYVLTGLHGLHVIAGLVPLLVVTRRAWAGRYSAQNHAGVSYIAMYWHFLDAVWLVLFATLLLSV
jgi:cytochrome c oxidase subunit III